MRTFVLSCGKERLRLTCEMDSETKTVARKVAMPGTTLTVALGGEIQLDQFAESMQRFQRLIDALTNEVGGKASIEWVIDELTSGSAIATVRGDAEQTEDIVRVVKAYEVVGRALEGHDVIPYSPRVASAARSLTSVIDGNITFIRFETDAYQATVTTGAADQSQAYLSAFGAVEGRIETLRSRRGLSFTLYDSLNDRAVNCRLGLDQHELVRDAWDKRVLVEGWVKREPTSGKLVEINPVQNITILPEVVPGSYKRARAILTATLADTAPEDRIRQLRDVE